MSMQYRLFTNLSSSIIVSPVSELSLDDYRLYDRTYRNLIKFIISKSPVSLVVFTEVLSKEDREKVRKYFCHKAKQDKMNYVYFPFLCIVYTDVYSALDPSDVVDLSL